MAREIEGPDGVVIEFDDDTPEDTIKQVMAKRYPPDNSAKQWAKVTTGAVAPYAGAAMLGPEAPVALGLGDLTTMGGNALTRLFGGDKNPGFFRGRIQPLPSELIRQPLIDAGLAANPQTPTQQVYSDVLGAATGGGAQAFGANAMAKSAKLGPQFQGAMKFLGTAPGVQTAASASGALAPSVAANYMGIKDPAVLAALGLGGGMAAGFKASPKATPINPQTIIDRGTDAYKAIEAQGVQLTPGAIRSMANDAENAVKQAGFIPRPPSSRAQFPDAAVGDWLKVFRDVSAQPLDFSKMDHLHSSLMSEAATTKNPNTQRLLYVLADKVDDFMGGVQPGHTTAGNAGTVSADLKAARKDYRTGKRSETIAGAFDRAESAVAASKTSVNKKGIPLGEALHQQFLALTKNKREFARFNPDEQAAIKDVVEGNNVRHALASLGKLAPSSWGNISTELSVPGGLSWMATGSPVPGALFGGGLMGVGMAAKRQANKLGVQAAEGAQRYIGGATPPVNTMPIILGISSREAIAADHRNRMAQRNKSQSRR